MDCGENVIRKPLIRGFCLVIFIYTHISSNQLVFVYKKKTKKQEIVFTLEKRFGAFCGVNNNLTWSFKCNVNTVEFKIKITQNLYFYNMYLPPLPQLCTNWKGFTLTSGFPFPTRWIGGVDPQTCHLSIFIFGSCHATCLQWTHQKYAAAIKHRIQEPIASVTPETPQNVWRELEYHLYVRRATNGVHIELR